MSAAEDYVDELEAEVDRLNAEVAELRLRFERLLSDVRRAWAVARGDVKPDGKRRKLNR